MRKIDEIKDQVRRLLTQEAPLTAIQLASFSNPPVSSAAMSIALNQLFAEGEVRHLPGKGWAFSDNGEAENADAS